MAELTGKAISEFPEASTITDEYLFAVRDSGTSTRKVSWARIKERIASAFFPLSIANGGTGTAASTKGDVYNGIGVYGLDNPITLGSGVDLNAAQSPGTYFVSGEHNNLPEGLPSSANNYLTVSVNGNFTTQMLYSHAANNVGFAVYSRVRYLSDGSPYWTSWREVRGATVGSGLPINRGGTGATSASDALSNLGGIGIVQIRDAQFTGSGIADLVDAMNRNNSSIPTGVCVLQIGSTTQINKAALLVSKVSATYGGAVASSYLAQINGAKLRIISNSWTNE